MPTDSFDLLTDEQGEIFQTINCVFLSTMLCFFGITANTINVIIFFKQGFGYTMNISLCGLSLSDLLCLVAQLWVNVCFNPLLIKADVPFVPEQIQYLTGATPMVICGRINSWITVFITAERCLGVALPLKVKQIITPPRTMAIICIIYIANILSIATEYVNYGMAWVFNPEKNKTLYSLVKNMPDSNFSALTYIMYLLIGSISFIAIIVFTVILTVKLGEKSAWRQGATSSIASSTTSKSNRDRKTMKMIVLIAAITIACYTPLTLVALAMIYEPEFSFFGGYGNTFVVAASCGYIFLNINSSVNIFLYYNMSTKYRQTFQEMFAKFSGKNVESST